MKIPFYLLGTSFAGTLPNSCQGGKQLNLLAELISATPVAERKGITLVRDYSPEFKKEVNGYRFDEEARLLSLRAAEALGNCSKFPSESSLLLTIKPGRIDTKGQFLITLLERQARPHRPLFGIRLHYDTIYLDLPNVSHRNSPRVHVPNLHDGWWHSIFVTFAEGQIQVSVDCEVMTVHNPNDQAMKKLTSEVDLTKADFYLGSRRVPKQRFKGLFRQVRFGVGFDISRLCESDSFVAALAERRRPAQIKADFSLVKFETNSPGDNFCDARARGHLLYGGENDLMLCDGHSWKGLMGASRPRLNFIEKIGTFEPKEPILHSCHFTIPGEGYFMVTTSSKKVSLWRWAPDSSIFKEDKTSELRADGASSSTFFAFENAFYLIIATV